MEKIVLINEFFRLLEEYKNSTPGIELLKNQGIPESEANLISKMLVLIDKFVP